MPPKVTRETRSMSGDGASEELENNEEGEDDSAPSGKVPSKPGRKRNPNTPAARRDQNRIAQREFRLRKQQRIRDLEARVELLSGSKEDTFIQLRGMLTDLMHENHTLRMLVRDLSSFIGDGMGGFLPKLGWDMPSFQEFVSRAETDTAFEAFTARKKPTAGEASGSSSVIGQKRRAEDVDPSILRKKTKPNKTPGPEELVGPTKETNGGVVPSYPFPGRNDPLYPPGRSDSGLYMTSPFPGPSSAPSGFSSQVPYPPSSRHHELNAASTGPSSSSSIYAASNYAGQYTLPPLYPQPSSSGATPFSPTTSSGVGSFSTPASASPNFSTKSTYTPAAGSSYQPTAPSPILPPLPPSAPSDPSPSLDGQDDESMDLTGKKGEATKLILYHLQNYKRNPAYCLPPSLRPTLVQRTIPHEGVVDGVIYPELRDRMILLKGRYDLAECVHLFYRTVTVHGDDVIAHANWEVDEAWFRQFGLLVDQNMLTLTNRWRRERGESELLLSDIAPEGMAFDGDTPAPE